MSTHLTARIFRPQVLAMSAYKVADARNLIKLDAMENPYTWPEEIIAQWLELIKFCPFNRYPDPDAATLVSTLKKINHIPEQNGLLLGNGSDEIIQILLQAMTSDSTVMTPEPGFVMYRQIALSMGLNYVGIPLRSPDFRLDLPAMLKAVEHHQPEIIFIAYPNNPTGNLFEAEDILRIIDLAPGLVIIDEAYAPFTDASFIEQLGKYANLMVMRTVSKLGLAGLRLGFLAGDSDLIEQLNKVRLPYNINSLTQMTADFALNNSDFLQQQTARIRQQRGWLFSQLNSLQGIHAFPSEANFILFKTDELPASHIFAALKAQGVLIKNLSSQGGQLEACLRVTVGTKTENQAFVGALRHIVKAS